MKKVITCVCCLFLAFFCFSYFDLVSGVGSQSTGDMTDFDRIMISPKGDSSQFLQTDPTNGGRVCVGSCSENAHITGQIISGKYGLVRFFIGWPPYRAFDPLFILGRVLAVNPENPENREICTCKVHDDYTAQWVVYSTGDGYYVIGNRAALGDKEDHCLDYLRSGDFPKRCLTYDLSTHAVTLAKYTGGDNQKWRIDVKKDDLPASVCVPLLSNNSHVFLRAGGTPAFCLYAEPCIGSDSKAVVDFRNLYSWCTLYKRFDGSVVFQHGRRPYKDTMGNEGQPWFAAGRALGFDEDKNIITCPMVDGARVLWRLIPSGKGGLYWVKYAEAELYLTYDLAKKKVVVAERSDLDTLCQVWDVVTWERRDQPYDPRH